MVLCGTKNGSSMAGVANVTRAALQDQRSPPLIYGITVRSLLSTFIFKSADRILYVFKWI